MRAVHPAVVTGLVAVALGGCGSGGASDRGTLQREDGSNSTDGAKPADPAATRVIRGWTDAERRSDYVRAASYFSVPSLVQNGPALVLRTRRAVVAFNRSFPCGARLLRTVALGSYTAASFRLTERPGGSCDAPGDTAAVAFLVRGGKIREWRRIAAMPDEGSRRPPPVEAPPVTGPAV